MNGASWRISGKETSNNRPKIASAKSLPYFVKYNKEAVKEMLNPTLTIEERAAKRHAARTPEKIADIKSRAEARQKRHALIKKTAENVLKVSESYSEVDSDVLILKKAIAENNLTLMQQQSRTVAKAVSVVKKQESALSDLIPDVHEWHKQFSISELQTVHDAVKARLAKESTDLIPRKSFLENEIKWVEKHKKYNTWEVAQAAYKKELDDVNRRIDEIKAKITTVADIKSTLGNKCPKTIENLQKEIDNMEQTKGWSQADKDKFTYKMLELFDNSDYGMNVPLFSRNGDDVIEQIFNSYFKSQQETGTGKGAVNINYRNMASLNLFGTDISKAIGDDFEKYGFLMDKDIIKQAQSGIAGQYWDYGNGIQIRFDKKKVITTFTLEDSLGSGLKPSLTTDPHLTSLDTFYKDDVMKIPTTSTVDFTHKMYGSYVELQYHGHLGLDCIESIYIPSKILPKIKSDTLQKMKNLKCKIYTDDSTGSLSELK